MFYYNIICLISSFSNIWYIELNLGIFNIKIDVFYLVYVFVLKFLSVYLWKKGNVFVLILWYICNNIWMDECFFFFFNIKCNNFVNIIKNL